MPHMNDRTLKYIIADNCLTQSCSITFTCQDSYCMNSLLTELTNINIKFYDIDISKLQIEVPAMIWHEQLFDTLQKTLIANDMLLVMSTKQSANKLVITNTGNDVTPYCMFTMQVITWLKPCEWLCHNKKLYAIDSKHYNVYFALTGKTDNVNDNNTKNWCDMQAMVEQMLKCCHLNLTTEVIYHKFA